MVSEKAHNLSHNNDQLDTRNLWSYYSGYSTIPSFRKCDLDVECLCGEAKHLFASLNTTVERSTQHRSPRTLYARRALALMHSPYKKQDMAGAWWEDSDDFVKWMDRMRALFRIASHIATRSPLSLTLYMHNVDLTSYAAIYSIFTIAMLD